MSIVDILIPTWNNPQFLYPCVGSIVRHTMPVDLFHIYVVNNGEAVHMEPIKDMPQVTILQQEKNLGWEGGLKAGLAASKAPFVLFMNDDTFVPSHQRLWLTKLLDNMADIDCAAVGPTSNVVMGKQQIFLPLQDQKIRAKFLINFCCLVRREALDAVGGVDDTLPGGDDLDQSIRLRKAGKYLLIDRDVFVYHHGFKTGERIHGDDWNSIAMTERTNHALIRKHGFRAFLDLWSDDPSASLGPSEDTEGDIVRRFAVGEKIAELGCGDKKTIQGSIGIDIILKGDPIPGVAAGRISIADVNANVENDLPIKDFDVISAQHVLEHMVDAVGAVMSWKKSLRPGGRLIVAVPDHTVRNTIPMNWEHRHAWTPSSLKRFMESLGWKTVDLLDANNNVSFVGVFERNGS